MSVSPAAFPHDGHGHLGPHGSAKSVAAGLLQGMPGRQAIKLESGPSFRLYDGSFRRKTAHSRPYDVRQFIQAA